MAACFWEGELIRKTNLEGRFSLHILLYFQNLNHITLLSTQNTSKLKNKKHYTQICGRIPMQKVKNLQIKIFKITSLLKSTYLHTVSSHLGLKEVHDHKTMLLFPNFSETFPVSTFCYENIKGQIIISHYSYLTSVKSQLSDNS